MTDHEKGVDLIHFRFGAFFTHPIKGFLNLKYFVFTRRDFGTFNDTNDCTDHSSVGFVWSLHFHRNHMDVSQAQDLWIARWEADLEQTDTVLPIYHVCAFSPSPWRRCRQPYCLPSLMSVRSVKDRKIDNGVQPASIDSDRTLYRSTLSSSLGYVIKTTCGGYTSLKTDKTSQIQSEIYNNRHAAHAPIISLMLSHYVPWVRLTHALSSNDAWPRTK